MVSKISLSGGRGSGKSTVAQILTKYKDNESTITLSFAAPLKQFLEDLLWRENCKELIQNALYGDKDNTYLTTKGVSTCDVVFAMRRLVGKDYNALVNKFIAWVKKEKLVATQLTGRELLQKVGTEFFRLEVSPTFWVDLMRSKIEQFKDTSVLVDDTRFPDEFDLLWMMGFTMINVVNPEEKEKDRHISENALEDAVFDLVFVNDKALGKGNILNFVEKNL